jgi:hypothetical protein
VGIRVTKVAITTTGVAGSATGNADSEPIRGEILGVFLKYTTQPGTADVTIKATSPADYNLLVVTNGNTDGYIALRAKPVDNANTAITNAHAPFAVAGKVNVAVAQGDAATDALIAHIFWRD